MAADFEVLVEGGHQRLVSKMKDYADRSGGTGTTQITDGAVTTDKVANGAITAGKLASAVSSDISTALTRTAYHWGVATDSDGVSRIALIEEA